MNTQKCISAEEFNSLKPENQKSVVATYITPTDTYSLVFELLSHGRYTQFMKMSRMEQNMFRYLHHLGEDAELLFMVHEVANGRLIQPYEMESNTSFETLKDTLDYEFESYSISDELQKAIHKYFQVNGDYLPEDAEINPNAEIFELSQVDRVSGRNRALMTHTVIGLSEIYGDKKVLPIFERVTNESLLNPKDLIQLVKSNREIPDSMPLSWFLELYSAR